ncbi:hypothetical protein ACH5RR_035896 [Cinchona calisaya]|uniref:Uncharacterized protein n=1 Tax=Cinchona calisaya TaxID=153742 RepID=A0ABD2Y1L1_9GENT
MGKSPCCAKMGLKKGTWTPEEDQKLLSYIERHGHGSWRALPAKAGLQRCGKSCRLRWLNYLRPDIKRGKFSLQEEQRIIQLHALLGNRWSAIATHLPMRTDNEIKNYWNTHLKKKLTKMGIDPTTHKPKINALIGSSQQKDTANLSHMAQWENARLEAESRLVRESKFTISTTPQVPFNKVTDISLLAPPLEQMVPPCLDILKVWQGTWTTKTTGIFTSNIGSLQSPNSTLHFSDNIFTLSRNAYCFGENLQFPALNYEGGITKENGQNNLKCLVKQNPDLQLEGETTILDNTVQFSDIESPIFAAYVEECLRPPIFVDGFSNADTNNLNNTSTGPFHDLDHSNSGGDLEDNRKYWNNTVTVDKSTLG